MIFVAPVRSYKTKLIETLIKEYPHYFEKILPFSTKQQKDGDIEQKDYIYMRKEDFKKDIETGDFLEYIEYQGNYYGTNWKSIKEVKDKGKICLIDLDLKGAKKIFEKKTNFKYLYLLPTSLEEFREHLHALNKEDVEVIEKRVNNTKNELEKLS